MVSAVELQTKVRIHGIVSCVQDVPSCNNPAEFKCRNSSYCISRKLVCNHVRNCGMEDRSDEIDCNYHSDSNVFSRSWRAFKSLFTKN